MSAARAFHGLATLPPDLGPTVVTVGVFDGVHRGHRYLLDRVVEEAAGKGLPAGAVTFDRHPLEVLRPGDHPPLLTTLGQKIHLLGAAGMDFVLVLPFTLELAAMPAEEFAGSVLVDAVRARSVVVGANFRFGHKAAGDVRLLEAVCRPRGVAVIALELLAPDGDVVTSSRVRAEVASGDVEAAARSLGRPYAVLGQVGRGDGRGRELGVPTANLILPPRTALPANGVYAGHLQLQDGPLLGASLPAVTSVGSNPTFGGTSLRVEAHVLDFDADLYGRQVSLTFEHRLREERTFAGPDELIVQMRRDIERSRRLLEG